MIPALSRDFGPFQGRTWLNAAHQGPLPRAARLAIQAATRMKVRPARLPDDAFWEVPRRLRAALAKLIGARTESIALTNSTTYGINVVAQGFDFRHGGDEVLLVDGDFPATVLPWWRAGTSESAFCAGREVVSIPTCSKRTSVPIPECSAPAGSSRFTGLRWI